MKRLLIIITTVVLISSCATTNETKPSKLESRKDEIAREQGEITQAVESRRFLIKLDRLYYSHGGAVDLIPRSNYIIIDGNTAVIRAAYLGKQYAIRPIAGINIHGQAIDYQLTKDLPKGTYKIKMQVTNGPTRSFDVFLRISKNGSCSASVTSLVIDYLNYSGQLVPLKDNINNTSQPGLSQPGNEI
jgi:Domain of unknown function (DUF4251)